MIILYAQIASLSEKKNKQVKAELVELDQAWSLSGTRDPYLDSSDNPGGWGDSHMEQTGMLVGNFEFNP